jgi:small subunit ribosomal protein S4
MQAEKKITEFYGLRRKNELWRAQTLLRKKRKIARSLLVADPETREKKEKELLGYLSRLGILSKTAGLDDVLGLKVEDFLERRLQTLVWRKGLALTIKQARQLVVHKNIEINGRVVSAPSYLVKKDEEDGIYFHGKKIMTERKKEKAVKKIEEIKPKEIEEKIIAFEEEALPENFEEQEKEFEKSAEKEEAKTAKEEEATNEADDE